MSQQIEQLRQQATRAAENGYLERSRDELLLHVLCHVVEELEYIGEQIECWRAEAKEREETFTRQTKPHRRGRKGALKPWPSVRDERIQAAAEGDTYELGGETYTVGPKCEHNVGNWVCITHGEPFPNQMQKDIHCDRGHHKLCWNCHIHGPEVP